MIEDCVEQSVSFDFLSITAFHRDNRECVDHSLVTSASYYMTKDRCVDDSCATPAVTTLHRHTVCCSLPGHQTTLLASYPGRCGGGKDGLVSTVCACAQISFISRKTPSNFCCISKRIRLRTRCSIQPFLNLSRANDIPRLSVPTAFMRPRIPDTVIHCTIAKYRIRCYPDYQKIWQCPRMREQSIPGRLFRPRNGLGTRLTTLRMYRLLEKRHATKPKRW